MGADQAEMQLICKFNKGFRFLFCVIDIYNKYTWVIPLKDKGITITNAFQKISDESNCKPNKIWVDKSSEFYNISMKSWPERNDIEMYSTYDEGKSKSVFLNKFLKHIFNVILKLDNHTWKKL